jgi:hypothetical protein
MAAGLSRQAPKAAVMARGSSTPRAAVLLNGRYFARSFRVADEKRQRVVTAIAAAAKGLCRMPRASGLFGVQEVPCAF